MNSARIASPSSSSGAESNESTSDDDGLSLDAEFRRSLLGVLMFDFIVLLAWLGWSRRASSLALLGLASLLVPVVTALALRPAIRRTVTLLVRREKSRRKMIVPIAVSVVLASLGLHIGERAANLGADSSTHHLGLIDEIVVSPSAQSRNQALDVLTRAKQDDLRVKAAIDDAIPFAASEGSLRVGTANIAVSVVEIDLSVMRAFGRFVPVTANPEPAVQEVQAALNAGEVAVGAEVLALAGQGISQAQLSIAGEQQNMNLRALSIPGLDRLDLFGDGNATLGLPLERPVVYVAPGTVTTSAARMADKGLSANVRYAIAISNRGSVVDGRRESEASTQLLQSLLASPPAGPVAIPAEDPLGLGGESITVAAPIDATVIPVKAQHERRIGTQFSQSGNARRLARAALIGAAIGVVLLSHVLRRRMRADRNRTLKLLGLRGRTALLIGTAFEAVNVLLGIGLGLIGSLVAGRLTGQLSALDPSLLANRTNLSRAMTLTSVVASLPTLGVFLLLLIPRKIRRAFPRVQLRRLPDAVIPVAGLLALFGGGYLTFRHATETTLAIGVVLAVFGAATVLGSTLFRSASFGHQTTRPLISMRVRAFALAAAATSAVVLPVVASQSVSTAASVDRGAWRSTVTLDDTTDAAGVLRQLVGSVGGRVIQRTNLLVEGGSNPQASTLATVTSAADELDSSWIPGKHQSADTPGAVIVSKRFASAHPGGAKINDRLVLRDVASGRSVEVTVVDVVSLATWAGDIATSDPVIATLRPTKEVLKMRAAVALTGADRAAIDSGLAIVAPSAPVRIVATDQGTSLSENIARWLRRVGVITFALLGLVALVLRTTQWRRVSPKVVGLAALFGSVVALVANGRPEIAQITPLVWIAAAMAACAGAAMLGVSTAGLASPLGRPERAPKVKEPKALKTAKVGREPKAVKEPRSAKQPRAAKLPSAANEAKKPRSAKQPSAANEAKAAKPPKESNAVKEPKPDKEPKAAKAIKPPKPAKPTKASKKGKAVSDQTDQPEKAAWTMANGWNVEN
jgi:hypothetical protein